MVDLVFGKILLVVCENEVCVLVLGYDVWLLKLVVFVILGVVIGLVGGLYVMMIGVVLLFNIEYYISEVIFVMIVIGGIGNLFVLVLGVSFYVLVGNWFFMLWLCWLMLLGLLLIVVSFYM